MQNKVTIRPFKNHFVLPYNFTNTYVLTKDVRAHVIINFIHESCFTNPPKLSETSTLEIYIIYVLYGCNSLQQLHTVVSRKKAHLCFIKIISTARKPELISEENELI